ncbi:hypothetical protein HX793_21825 [Pseudomonas reactans]|uniref:hypothetical protein n=1 Tax=Pseudomonas TaxID=286 RepID=UPI0015A21C25|nr:MULTISPECIES: hypothetical protein [Pseudomonas]NWA46601.1 hypothetical protein [Pseudomonas reactans]NWC39654.1 hypothetical protein [Pseudomonas tolaasii]NWC90596.1 hypothetical protein [Pseudomonas reactans]NWD32425.1 hypothetical protein [Pseudomonas reactans]NWF17435.1 hypothetical protein [Pseudomonas reactans]
MSRPIRNRYNPRERIQLDFDVATCVLNLNQHLQVFREFSVSDDRETFLLTRGEDARNAVRVHQIIACWLGLYCLGDDGEWRGYCRAFVEKFVEVDTGFAEVALADAVSYSQSLLESLDAARSQLAGGTEKGV